jgi:hypothetical protein
MSVNVAANMAGRIVAITGNWAGRHQVTIANYTVLPNLIFI